MNRLSFTSFKMFKYILPKGKDEYILFICLVLFYFVFSYPIIFNTSVIDSIEYYTDTYFSFDTPCFYHYGYTYLSAHPFILVFTYPILLIGDVLENITDVYKYKTLFVSIIANISITLSCIYIYRYCKQIISLNLISSLILAGIYSVFSTNFILSFTLETFTFSAFFLTFSLYYYSLQIKNNESIPFYGSIILTLIIGGITITNYPIAILPILLSHDTIKNNVKKIIIPFIILGLAIIIEKYSLSVYTFDGMGLTARFKAFTADDESFFKNVFDLFWGAPMIFSKIIPYSGIFDNKHFNAIILEYYQYAFQYIIVLLLTISISYSIIRGYKNKFILMCVATLLLNFFIHVIMKFGLADPFIYGGHWVYTIPLLMGWTQYYINSRIGRNIIISLYLIIFICLLFNNTVSMIEFTKIAESLFPAY